MKSPQNKFPNFYNGMLFVLFSITILQAKTDSTHGFDSNPTNITNRIAIDSTWFDDTTHSIKVKWHIDLSKYPAEKIYFSRIACSIGENLDTLLHQTPWDTINSAAYTSSVYLDTSNIIFDTSYTIGIWFQSYDDSSITYDSFPPTDSSISTILIHDITTKKNQTNVVNRIAIDTIWFDNTASTIRVQWHANLSQYPEGKKYFSGVTYSAGEILDSILTPMEWDSIGSETCTSSVYLDSLKTVFDTSYTVGIWIRSYFGISVPPTDSSTSKILINAIDSNLIYIKNQVAIDTTWFDNTSNSIRVQWHANLSQYPEGNKYVSGITYSIGETLDSILAPMTWDAVRSEICTSSVYLTSSNLVFDTSYTIGIWIQNYDSSSGSDPTTVSPTDSSTTTIKTPDFTWRKITLFPDTLNAITLINNKIILEKTNRNTVPIPAIIRGYKLKKNELPKGMIEVGGKAFRFDSITTQFTPFKLGMGFSKDLPNGITNKKIAIYQLKDGKFYINHKFETIDSTVWITVIPKIGMLQYPFMVLADQSPPKTSNITKGNKIIDTIDINSVRDSIQTVFKISDNIANVHWKFLYNSGNKSLNNFVKDTLDVSETEIITYITGNVDNVSSIINETFGVRAKLIVNDGIYEDTIDASRCVKSDEGERISINPGKWMPVSAATLLDSVDLRSNFNRSYPGWSYDNKNFRLFRWYPVNLKEKDPWLEYSENNKKHFTFLPGNLIWYKTTRDGFIKLDGGITIPLDKPYNRIVLRAKNWTDISNPFAFNIRLRDILRLKANYDKITKNIEIYHWVPDGQTYHYDQVYIPEIHLEKINTLPTIFYANQGNDGYTVYNRDTKDHKFQIPPTCIPLSPAPDTYKRSKRNTSDDGWVIDFRWKKRDNSNQSFYKRVRVGHKNNLTQPVKFGVLPPSMNKITVGTYDSSNKTIRSWSLQKSMKNGGMIFDIAINNSSSQDENIEFYLDNLLFLPKEVKAAILNPKKREYEIPKKTDPGGKQFYNDISIPSRVSTHRMLVIGSDDYLSYAQQLLTAYSFTFLKAYPNPFIHGIKILYCIPSGTKEVHFKLYNLMGKQLHSRVEKNYSRQGEYVFYFSNKGNPQKGFEPVPSGVYILHLTALNRANRFIYGGRKRIICIK